jgi:NADP-dependent 3-hydroxy acid dehydrogenase YdfG
VEWQTLRGKTAVVTGGSRGIGLAVARALSSAGTRVVLVARNRDRLERAARAAQAEWLVADLTDENAVREAADDVRGRLQCAPDFIVNSAGAFELAPLAETSVSSFDRMIGLNLRAVFLVARAFLPGMLQRGSGHIVSVGSIAGRQAFANNGAYSASKFGLRGLHAVLHEELRGTGVKATLIEPAATDTELWSEVDRERFPKLPAAESMLSVDAVAQAVLYALEQPPSVTVRNLIMEHT